MAELELAQRLNEVGRQATVEPVVAALHKLDAPELDVLAQDAAEGRSAELSSKLAVRVRFPSPAPRENRRLCGGFRFS